MAGLAFCMFSAVAGFFGVAVLPRLLADNSPPYVGLRHEQVKTIVKTGEQFCYYPTAAHRRACANVFGQHVFRNNKTDIRTRWQGTAKPGPMPKSKPWCVKAPEKPGLYEYFWVGTFEGCTNASHSLGFTSPSTFVTVEE